MPELIVKLSQNGPGFKRDQRSIQVYDTTQAANAWVSPGSDAVTRTLPVANQPSSRSVLSVRTPDEKVKPPCCYYTRGKVQVFAVADTGSQVVITKLVPVYDMVPSLQNFVTPSDDNPPADPDAQKVSDVMLDLIVSYDSYVKFSGRTEDGIRAVLGDDDTVIPSSSTGYEIEMPSVGARVKRTIVTNTDFRLRLNLNPTIVKNVSGL